MSLRWGIAGAGRISHDFVTAARTFPTVNHKFIAVAARTRENAEKFAIDHDIPKFCEGYLGLAQDTEIDIVYVANVNNQHFETAKMMLEHGKHVLCEKPLTLNEKQTKQLYQIAEERNLFLLEGLWSRYFPAYDEVKRIIDSGEIGDVLFVAATKGHAIQHVERITSKELGGGAILDLGCYLLQFQQYVFSGLKPIKVSVNGHLNSYGTDETYAAVITYPEGKMAVISASARFDLPNEGVIVGTKGTLKLPDFWAPTKLITPSDVKEYPLPKSSVPFFYGESCGLRYEAEEVRKCIAAGKTESPRMTHEESIELARLMDLLRKEIGVQFPEDFQEF